MLVISHRRPIIQKHIVVTLFLLLSSTARAQEAPQPFSAVQELFAAMSAHDEAAMRATSVPDFHLLEVGEIWNMDKLVSAVINGEGRPTRQNFFAVISSRISGDKAWVSYWNRAVFTRPGGEAQNVEWLESAVLVNRDDKWFIEMLHSTRMRANQSIPEGVDLQEYVTPEH